MQIRRAIVRAVNKMRGVSAEELRKMCEVAEASMSSVSMYLNISMVTYYDWEQEFRPIPPKAYERATEYLYSRWMESQMPIHRNAGKNARSKQEESGGASDE